MGSLAKWKQFDMKNGELVVKAGQTFVEGSPLMVSQSGADEDTGADGWHSGTGWGLLEACTEDNRFVGIAMQDAAVCLATKHPTNKCSFYFGDGIFTFQVADDGSSYPYDATKTYKVGQPITVNTASSIWTNDITTYSANKQRGVVIGKTSSSITILFRY